MEIKLDKNDLDVCKINGIKFPDRFKNKYLVENFNLTFNEYLIKYYLDDIIPICKCGCGTELKIKFYNDIIHIADYTTNHRPYNKHTDDIKLKIKINTKKAILNKFGVDNVFKLESIKNKIKKTNIERYGTENPMQCEEIKNKSHHYQTNETRQKIINTNQKKYGANSYTSSIIGKKEISDHNFKKYGVNNPMQTDEIKNKVRTTNLKLFYEKLLISDRLKNEYIPLFDFNDYNGVTKNRKYKFKHVTCGFEFYHTLDEGKIPICRQCYPILSGKSTGQDELYDFIKNLLPNEIILKNDRIALDNIQELDIYLPNRNLAIEYNGLYWHSELNGKNKKYHIGKTKFCYKKNIRLIHIFEDEWMFKKNIIKNIIKNMLNINEKVIYAKYCKIVEIENNIKNDFLDEYHLQGKDNSTIKLGAYYNDELVSVMTFGRHRLPMGGNTFDKSIYELYRFVTKYKIIGIADKLSKYFIKNYNPSEIITYSDLRLFTGNVYLKLGYDYIDTSNPNYWYMKGYNKREYRFNYTKKMIRDKLPIFDENLTEWQNMQLNGYDRIWDCGHRKYKFINNCP